MVNLPLSQTALRNKIVCTFKYSKGQNKRVKIQDQEFIGPTLALLIDPMLDQDLFEFSQRESDNGLIFTQSKTGNIRLNVSLDITVNGTSDVPENFIEVSRARLKNKRVQRDSFYVPLEIQI